MSYEEMSDFEIEKAVTVINDIDMINAESYEWDESQQVFWPEGRGSVFVRPFCSSWEASGPIIMDKKIGGHWGRASPGLYFAVSRCEKYVHADSNPLRAYMIVYLRMNEDNGH